MLWPLQSEADAFYGDPRGAGDEANPKWVADNLVKVACPWKLNNGTGAGSFTIHRKCADSLTRVLNAIWEGTGRSQERIDALRYNVFDGSYNYRNKRGGTSLSMHAYGAAIDWDAKDNEQHSQSHLFTSSSPLVVEFEREGWIWGGRWSPGSIDAMHVQAARVHGGDSVSKPGDVPDHPPPLSIYPPTVQFGSRGDDVRRVQQILFVDGVFGDVTKAEVESFQHDHGLVVDGIVGPATWQALLKTAPAHELPTPPAGKRMVGITATVFGGSSDLNKSAYTGKVLDDTALYVALPWRFTGERPRVRVLNHETKAAAVAPIEDVGPWNIDDPYWTTNTRPQAEGGTDRRGRKTNLAGIDLSPAMAKVIGISGKGLVDWEFETPITPPITPDQPDIIIRPPTPPADWRDFDLWGWIKSFFK